MALPASIALQCFLGLGRLPRIPAILTLTVTVLAYAAMVRVNLSGHEVTIHDAILYGAYVVGVGTGIVRTMWQGLARWSGGLGRPARA